MAALFLAELEAEARRLAVSQIVLTARDSAIEFYKRHGYAITGDADMLFGAVRHAKMAKTIR